MNSDRERRFEKEVSEKLSALVKISDAGDVACRVRLGEKPHDRAGERALSQELRSVLRETLGEDSLSSVTHTHAGQEHLTLAVGLRPGRVAGVGVDAEHLDREVTRAIFERIYALPAERKLASRTGLGTLPAWVIKEACFKSVPGNTQTVLSQVTLVRVDADPAGSFRGEALPPSTVPPCRIEFLAFQVEGFWISIAAAFRAERS